MPDTILDKVDVIVNKLIRLPALIELSVEGGNDINCNKCQKGKLHSK